MNTTPISPEMLEAGYDAAVSTLFLLGSDMSPDDARQLVAEIYTAMHSASQGVQGDVERVALERVRNGLRAYLPGSGVMSPVPIERLIEIIDASLSGYKERLG